jgi:hypothetical protein
VGAELFHADRWANMTKLIVAFRNSVNAPKTHFTHFKKSNHLKSFNDVAF